MVEVVQWVLMVAAADVEDKKMTHEKNNDRKSNNWKTVAIMLGIVLLVSLYYNLTPVAGNAGNDANDLSESVATKKAISVVNTNLLAGKAKAEIVKSSEESGVYKMTISVDGEELDAFVTKDGKYLMTGGIDLQTPPKPPAAAVSSGPVDMESLMDDDAVRGNPDATVTIVEFSDFECPFCGRFYSQTYGQIKSEYIDTGKVKYVFRDFPLGFHSKAQKAAEAAECAEEQGKFWEMHDMLFENQNNIAVKDIKGYARDLELDGEAFDECLDSGKYYDEVQEDMADGAGAGVTGTPAFFINGQMLSGAQPFSSFKQVIDAELAK